MDICLRELRDKMGITAEQIAKRLCVSRVTVTHWENGQNRMSLDQACDVCDILGCTLDELAGRTSMSLSTAEAQLIRDFRSSDARGQAAILNAAQFNRGASAVSSTETLIIYGNG